MRLYLFHLHKAQGLAELERARNGAEDVNVTFVECCLQRMNIPIKNLESLIKKELEKKQEEEQDKERKGRATLPLSKEKNEVPGPINPTA